MSPIFRRALWLAGAAVLAIPAWKQGLPSSHIEHIQSDLSEIKSDIREIKRDARTDFRLVFGALIVGALGLAGLMAKGFHWIGG